MTRPTRALAFPLALLLTSCARGPRPTALPADVVACIVGEVGLAVVADVVGPLLAHETSGTVTVDVRHCGAPAVLDEADAARLSTALEAGVTGAVALVELSDDPCVDAWAAVIGDATRGIAVSLPGALAGAAPASMPWAVAVDGCGR